jgi:hypothetical protein
MKIEILSIAMNDIQFGQQFYEKQQEGLGAYFLDSLFSDIDALLLYAGIHQQFSVTFARFRNDSPTQSITA